jgi:hypothetical protein
MRTQRWMGHGHLCWPGELVWPARARCRSGGTPFILGRRIRRRWAVVGWWAIGRSVGAPVGRRHRRVGTGFSRHNAGDVTDDTGARVEHDAHENAAIVGGAEHIGRAFAQWSRQRLEPGRTDGAQDLIGGYETGHRPGLRRNLCRRRTWRGLRCRLRMARSAGQRRENQRQARNNRTGPDHPCPPMTPTPVRTHIARVMPNWGGALAQIENICRVSADVPSLGSWPIRKQAKAALGHSTTRAHSPPILEPRRTHSEPN